METTRTTGPLRLPRGVADRLARLRERLCEDVPRIAAETGCDEAAVLALFASRIERAIPAAASPAIAASLARLRAEVDAQIGARVIHR